MDAESTIKPIDEQAKARAEAGLKAYRRAGMVRRAEQDRIADEIEQLLYEATQIETVDTLVRLARHIFDPRRPGQ